MKHYTCSLFLGFCLFSSLLRAQPQFGGRAMLSFVYLGQNAALDENFVSATSRFGGQAGVQMRYPLSERIEINGEFNYSLAGYSAGVNSGKTKIEKINYHYLGITAVPAFVFSDVVSAGVGAAANVLLNDPGDLDPTASIDHQRLDVSLVGALTLRHPPFEIQLRYQYALLPFVSDEQDRLSFRMVGVGLGYTF
ncbi:MAG: outer membrane beta-barrel protein [Saprospirales bacterium]|nr:outer membrane beta-barrel protein [Saprospirales bacterium]